MVLNLSSRESKKTKRERSYLNVIEGEREFGLDLCHRRYIRFKLIQKKIGNRNVRKNPWELTSLPHPFSYLFIIHKMYIYYL